MHVPPRRLLALIGQWQWQRALERWGRKNGRPSLLTDRWGGVSTVQKKDMGMCCVCTFRPPDLRNYSFLHSVTENIGELVTASARTVSNRDRVLRSLKQIILEKIMIVTFQGHDRPRRKHAIAATVWQKISRSKSPPRDEQFRRDTALAWKKCTMKLVTCLHTKWCKPCEC